MQDLQMIEEKEVLGQTVKVYGTTDDPLFLAKDVAEWIGHTNASVMLRKVDEDEKVVNNVYTLGGSQGSWFLTEDGLYEVLMQSRKPIAKEFKKQVKQILKQIRQTGGYIPINAGDDEKTLLAKAVLVAETTIKSLNDKITIDAPKVKYVNALEVNEDAILVKEMANLLCQRGMDIGQQRLFKWLRENGYLCKATGVRYNTPTQYAMNLGLFEIKKGYHFNSLNQYIPTTTPMVTAAGQVYFINKFLSQNLLPDPYYTFGDSPCDYM